MIRDRFSEKLQTLLGGDEWLILQDEYDAAENLNYESLFCLTNGYLGTRGSYEEGTVKSLPCTFVNGVFDKSETFMRELANLPNWLGIRLYVEKELIGIENCSILEFSRVLDMKHAMLVKRFLLEDKKGRQTLVEGIRFVSRANVHRMAVKLYVTPINYDGIIEVENIVDGSVINFADAPRFKVKHTYLVANERLTENGVYIECATRDNHLHVGTGAFLDAERNGKSVIKTRQFYAFGEQTIEFQDFDAEQGVTTEITKYASIYTERDLPKYELHSAVKNEIDAFVERGFEQELAEHFKVYEEMWKEADIQIQGDFDLDRAVRFNIFHLMSTGNEHDDRVNVGAKLLHGEEYGGHAFWDTELFMLPFLCLCFSENSKKSGILSLSTS